MRLSSGVIRPAAVVAVLSVTLLVGGCADASPGVVAYVGDTEITQQQVDDAVAAVTTTTEQGQTVSSEAVVNAMIQGELSAQIAREQNIPITDTDRDTLLRDTNLAPLLDVPGAKPIAYDVADQSIVVKKLGEAAFLADIEKRKVTLNPRYGVLDPKQQMIAPEKSGSLSEPAAAATP